MIAIYQKQAKKKIVSNVDYITIKLKETNSDLLIHVSSMNPIWDNIEEWEVLVIHEDTKWTGMISSKKPNSFICASNLSGWFNIVVRAKYKGQDWRWVKVKKGYKGKVKSFPNSVSLLIIETHENLDDAKFYVIGNNVFSNILERTAYH